MDKILAENCEFFLPHSDLKPSLGVNQFEFWTNFLSPRLESILGLSVGEDFVIIAGVVLTQCQGVTLQTHGRTHGGTDGPTDRRTIRSNTELYISSYADAL